jgi:hypothetical protein
MLLAEDLLLLVTDPNEASRASYGRHYSEGLAGAVVVELALRGAVAWWPRKRSLGWGQLIVMNAETARCWRIGWRPLARTQQRYPPRKALKKLDLRPPDLYLLMSEMAYSAAQGFAGNRHPRR